MAKQVSVRLTTDGGDRVRAVFFGIGEDGKKAFGKIDEASKKASSSADVFIRDTARSQKQVDALRASIDPAFRSQQQYARAQELVNKAVANGAITQQRANQMMLQARGAFTSASEGVVKLNRGVGLNSFAMRNFAMQLNQVGQQGLVTGNYLGAAAIQLPDLLLGFGTLGAIAGVAAVALVPLIKNLFGTEDAAKVLKEELKTLDTAMGDLRSASGDLASPIDDLRKRYGRFTGDAREVLRLQREIAAVNAARAATSMAQAMQGTTLGGFRSDLSPERIREIGRQLPQLRAELEAIENQVSSGNLFGEGRSGLDARRVEILGILSASNDLVRFLERVSEEFGVTADQAGELAAAMREAATVEGPEAQATALLRLDELIQSALGGIENMSDEQLKNRDALLESVKANYELASIDIASGIAAAASSAAALARNLGISVENASRILAMGGGPDPVIFDPRDPRYNATRAEMERLREDAGTVSPFDESRIPKAKKGRGGGGTSAAQKALNEQMRDAERIFEATRTAQEKYNAELGHAKELLDAGAISTDTYTRYSEQLGEQLRKDAGGIDVVGQAVDGVSESIARSLVYADDLRDGLRQVWQGIAFDILNSAIRDALKAVFDTSSLGGGGSSWISEIVGSVLSFDGGGSTGYGPRSGGLDGKGGYLAMVHPRERVIDETRAVQGGGGTSVVRVELSGDLVAQVLQQAAGQSVQIVSGALQGERTSLQGRMDMVGARGTSVA